MFRYFILAFSLILLAGCAAPNPPLFIMYPDTVIIKEQAEVATIITSYQVTIDGVNYEDVPRVLNENYDEELWAYDVAGGEHYLQLTFTPVINTRNTSGGAVYTTRHTYKDHTVGIRYNFEAGNVYWATLEGSYSQGTSAVRVEKGSPADKKRYQERDFDPAKVIENINKARLAGE